MGRKGIYLSLIFMVFISFGISADFENYLIYVHSPAAMALAPNVVSIETGPFSSIENPALSTLNPSTGISYMSTQYSLYTRPLNIYMLTLKSYFKMLSFSATGYRVTYLDTTQGVVINIAAKLWGGLSLGGNLIYYDYLYVSEDYFGQGVDTTHFGEWNGDIGLSFARGFTTGPIKNGIYLGLAANNLRTKSNAGVQYKGGIAYKVSDKDGRIPLFDEFTLLYERDLRLFQYDVDGFGFNYSTIGVEVKILNLYFRLGKTDVAFNDHVSFSMDSNVVTTWNYGFGYETELREWIFAESPVTLRVDFAKTPEYYDILFFWLNSENRVYLGSGISVELKSKFGIGENWIIHKE